uniref:Abscisic acid receptor PYR1 n=1 Tax=Ananas comosus var. bracteatus TaxID=296719 RepID=A0A6V7QW45_ANACO
MESGGGGEGGGGGGEEEPEPAPGPAVPAGLTAEEYAELRATIEEYHRYAVGRAMLVAPGAADHGARGRGVGGGAAVRPAPDLQALHPELLHQGRGEVRVGCLREVSVISGLPASTSTERLDVLDDDRRVAGFTIIGGEHRLRNYRSVTTVTEFRGSGGNEIWTVVLESYVVDVPRATRRTTPGSSPTPSSGSTSRSSSPWRKRRRRRRLRPRRRRRERRTQSIQLIRCEQKQKKQNKQTNKETNKQTKVGCIG